MRHTGLTGMLILLLLLLLLLILMSSLLELNLQLLPVILGMHLDPILTASVPLSLALRSLNRIYRRVGVGRLEFARRV